MPSKFEYELTKLRGEVSDTNEVYTNTVAHLKDLITSLEAIVNTLDTDLSVNKQRTSSALRKASKGISMANSAAQKVSGTITNCTLNNCIIEEIDATSHDFSDKGRIIYYNGKLYFTTGSAHEIITSVHVE